MENSIGFMILLQIVLIALNAVFACAEIAAISMNDSKLAKMAADGDRRAVRLTKLTSQSARFLATIQVAITLSGFLGSAFAAENFSGRLVNWLTGLGVTVPAVTLEAISVVAITLVLSYFTLIFGQLVPKRVAMRKAEALALGMSALISGIAKLFAPIVWFLTIEEQQNRKPESASSLGSEAEIFDYCAAATGTNSTLNLLLLHHNSKQNRTNTAKLRSKSQQLIMKTKVGMAVVTLRISCTFAAMPTTTGRCNAS